MEETATFIELIEKTAEFIEDEKLDVSNTFSQGNQNGYMDTTDRIIVKFDTIGPKEFSIKRKSKFFVETFVGAIKYRTKSSKKAKCYID